MKDQIVSAIKNILEAELSKAKSAYSESDVKSMKNALDCAGVYFDSKDWQDKYDQSPACMTITEMRQTIFMQMLTEISHIQNDADVPEIIDATSFVVDLPTEAFQFNWTGSEKMMHVVCKIRFGEDHTVYTAQEYINKFGIEYYRKLKHIII